MNCCLSFLLVIIACPLSAAFIRELTDNPVNPIPHGGRGADSALLQIVFLMFFITSVRDAAEPRNVVTFPKFNGQ